jgi:hypothetical protein
MIFLPFAPILIPMFAAHIRRTRQELKSDFQQQISVSKVDV